MSTSKYVINFDELTSDLIPKLKSLSKNVRRNSFELDEKISKSFQEILDNIPENLNLKDIVKNTNELATFLQQIDELKGDFHVDGEFKNIPAISLDYEIIFSYEMPIYLTGVVFNLSAWREKDRWSLVVDNKTLFDKISIKEVSDKKYFNTPYFVDSLKKIKIIFHNFSGNSRQVWCDLEYIQSQFADMILVKCVDKDDNLLRIGYVPITQGILQTVTAPLIDNYYLVTTPDYVQRVFTADNRVVVFVYDKLILIHVKCINKTNGDVLKKYDVKVNPTKLETINAPNINEYSIVGTSTITKIFKDDEEIIFEYVKYINITIKCIDEYGNVLKFFTKQIAEDEITTVDAPDILGYKLTSKTPVSGVFSDGDVIEFKYKHPWGIKVVMQWEDNIGVDVDIYGIYNDKVVWYGHKAEGEIWLDRDVLTHINNNLPEILTCNYDTGKLIIGMNNYNGKPSNKPVTFTIIKYDNMTHIEQTIATMSVDLDTNVNNVYAVCEIDLERKIVTELNHSDVIYTHHR